MNSTKIQTALRGLVVIKLREIESDTSLFLLLIGILMQALHSLSSNPLQSNMICCIERRGELIIAQRSLDGSGPELISAQLRPSRSPPLFGAYSRKSAIARLGNFQGFDTMCVIPLGECDLQHVPVHEVEEDQLEHHVLEVMSSGMHQQSDLVASGMLRIGRGSSRSVMGVAVNKEEVTESLRGVIEAGFNPRHLDIEELACIRGLHQTMASQDAINDFVLCRYTRDYMVLGLVGEDSGVRLLRKIRIDRSQDALNPFAIAASISHQIDMMMISAGQQSKLPVCGPRVYIAIDPCLGVEAMKAVRRNKMMAAISIDELDAYHPWTDRLMSEHGLHAYEAITMLGMLNDVSTPDEGRENSAEPSE